VVIGFCFGLLAQPKAFDPDYYMDTLKVKKSDEFKKLENYREKYKSLGLPLTGTGYAYGYPSFYADWFYHRGINLDRIHEYKKLGFFNSNTASDIYTDIYSNIFRPIIVIAKLSSFERAFYDDIATFDVISIIKGKEFYEKFPSSIKCYLLIPVKVVQVFLFKVVQSPSFKIC